MRMALLVGIAALVGTGLAPSAPAGEKKVGKIEWIRDFEKGRDLAADSGRPILLNFYCGT